MEKGGEGGVGGKTHTGNKSSYRRRVRENVKFMMKEKPDRTKGKDEVSTKESNEKGMRERGTEGTREVKEQSNYRG